MQHACVPVSETPVSHDTMAQTIVLERPSLMDARCLNLPPVHEIATLTVLSGADEGIAMRLGERKIYMGRMPQSEFILTDTNVSRRSCVDCVRATPFMCSTMPRAVTAVL